MNKDNCLCCTNKLTIKFQRTKYCSRCAITIFPLKQEISNHKKYIIKLKKELMKYGYKFRIKEI